MVASYGSDTALFPPGAKQGAPVHPLRAALQGREIWARPRRYCRWRFSRKMCSRLVATTLIFLGLIAGLHYPSSVSCLWLLKAATRLRPLHSSLGCVRLYPARQRWLPRVLESARQKS
jgi:hypothetical protein